MKTATSLRSALGPYYLVTAKDEDGKLWRLTFDNKCKPTHANMIEHLNAVPLSANMFTNNSDFQGFTCSEARAVLKFLHSKSVFDWAGVKLLSRGALDLKTLEVNFVATTAYKMPLADFGIKI